MNCSNPSIWDAIAYYASYPSTNTAKDLLDANRSKNQAVSGKIACRLVHSIPGRVRFRVPRLANDADYAHRLEGMIASQDGVIQVRVRCAAASIAIRYHHSQLSDVQMRQVLLELIQTSGQKAEGFLKAEGRGQKAEGFLKAEGRGQKAEGFLKAEGQDQGLNREDWITPDQDKEQIAQVDDSSEDTTEENDWSELKRPALATLLALLAGPLRFPIPQSLVAGSVAVAGLPVAKRAMASLLGEHRLTIDCLDLVAITLSSMQGNWLTPALMMTLHELGDIIRDRTARSSQAQATDLLDSIGQYAWMECDGEKQQVPLTEVKLGDTVIVYPGEQIPVDGVVLRGNATIDQQKLTGESMPVVREAGQTVYASTLVRSGELYIKVERVGADTCAGASI